MSDHLRPGFFIIGANKCGTSSLYRYLVDHPEVLPCAEKEPNFFGRHSPQHIADHIEDYFAMFPRSGDDGPVGLQWEVRDEAGGDHHTTLMVERDPGRAHVTGEATASTFHEVPPDLLHRHLPETRLIVLVRNPVDRASSHHRMYRRFYASGYELEGPVGDFESDIAAELEAHARGERTRYLTPGFYADLLERWEGAYGRDRILVIPTEDLADAGSAARTMAVVHGYLGLHPYSNPALLRRRFNWAPPDGMSPSVRAALAELYAPHNARLERRLGRSLGWR